MEAPSADLLTRSVAVTQPYSLDELIERLVEIRDRFGDMPTHIHHVRTSPPDMHPRTLILDP